MWSAGLVFPATPWTDTGFPNAGSILPPRTSRGWWTAEVVTAARGPEWTPAAGVVLARRPRDPSLRGCRHTWTTPPEGCEPASRYETEVAPHERTPG